MYLENRIAIVTGGATGIGRGIAVKFAEEGCYVIIADIKEQDAKETINLISKVSKGAEFIRCDVTNYKQIQSLVDKVIAKFGKIDILVNNAGGVFGNEGLIEDVTEELWDEIQNLNLKSQFLFCKAVVPHMKRKKYGKIVNISSTGATHPSYAVVHYHSAKAGVLGLTVNLAFELAPFNICVNAILPGPVRTPFWVPVTKGMSEEEKDAIFRTIAAKEIPLRRIGTPEDIAGAALYFASDLSSYVTGQQIYVAGGQPLPPSRDV